MAIFIHSWSTASVLLAAPSCHATLSHSFLVPVLESNSFFSNDFTTALSNKVRSFVWIFFALFWVYSLMDKFALYCIRFACRTSLICFTRFCCACTYSILLLYLYLAVLTTFNFRVQLSLPVLKPLQCTVNWTKKFKDIHCEGSWTRLLSD